MASPGWGGAGAPAGQMPRADAGLVLMACSLEGLYSVFIKDAFILLESLLYREGETHTRTDVPFTGSLPKRPQGPERG